MHVLEVFSESSCRVFLNWRHGVKRGDRAAAEQLLFRDRGVAFCDHHPVALANPLNIPTQVSPGFAQIDVVHKGKSIVQLALINSSPGEML